MHPEAVEGLLEESIFAEGRLAAKTLAAVGAGKQASRKRHRVHERQGGFVGRKWEELLLETLLDPPEVGRLAGEGGPMHLT